jgi:ABC-type phosphate transport system ATPase subunit
MKEIQIKNAYMHNLKNIDITIPKDKLIVVTGVSGSGKYLTYKRKHFATFNSDLKALKDWLLANHCTEVCMELTGKDCASCF